MAKQLTYKLSFTINVSEFKCWPDDPSWMMRIQLESGTQVAFERPPALKYELHEQKEIANKYRCHSRLCQSNLILRNFYLNLRFEPRTLIWKINSNWLVEPKKTKKKKLFVGWGPSGFNFRTKKWRLRNSVSLK